MPRLMLTIALLALSGVANRVTAADPPNIIVIMADDLGFGDVSCYGAQRLQTPNIDRLAAAGLRFTSGYCSASTCTPTRYSFLTGRYAFRDPGTGIAAPQATALIRPGTVTVASLLKKAGYRTAVIGKWHLGLGEDPGPDWNGKLAPGPLEIGFDDCYLLPTTNDRVPSVYVENHRVPNLDPDDPLWVGNEPPSPDHPTGRNARDTLRLNWSHGHNGTIHNGIGRIGYFTGGEAARWRDEDLADAWVERSIEWIEANKDGPFFLFFAAHDIHVPRMPHERFQGKTSLGLRGDAIVELDWCVGELVRTVDRLDLTEKTLIVFCSDNGPVLDDGYQDEAVEKLGDHLPAGPLRGGKYSIFEGGTRTPFITSWPGHIEPGSSSEIVCTIDLGASFAAIAGVELPEGACADSFDLSGALLGKSGSRGRDHLIEQDNGRSGRLGLRVGDWKLHRTPVKGQDDPRYELYHLVTDLAEKNDVAASHPDRVQALSQRLESLIEARGSRPGF